MSDDPMDTVRALSPRLNGPVDFSFLPAAEGSAPSLLEREKRPSKKEAQRQGRGKRVSASALDRAGLG